MTRDKIVIDALSAFERDINGRSGIGDAYAEVDSETRIEIRMAWARVVRVALDMAEQPAPGLVEAARKMLDAVSVADSVLDGANQPTLRRLLLGRAAKLKEALADARAAKEPTP